MNKIYTFNSGNNAIFITFCKKKNTKKTEFLSKQTFGFGFNLPFTLDGVLWTFFFETLKTQYVSLIFIERNNGALNFCGSPEIKTG